jgi:hypothetical protein
MRIGVVDEGEEALDHVERVVLLAQGEKGVRAATFLRRRGTSATVTHGVTLAGGRGTDLFDADLVAPGDVEVVLVVEALVQQPLMTGEDEA